MGRQAAAEGLTVARTTGHPADRRPIGTRGATGVEGSDPAPRQLVVAALQRDRRGELMQCRIAWRIRKQAPAHGVRGGQIAMAQSSGGRGQSIYARSTRLI